MRVLLVEDTAGLGEAVRDQISDDGHAVDWVQSLSFAQASVHSTSYNLILNRWEKMRDLQFCRRVHFFRCR